MPISHDDMNIDNGLVGDKDRKIACQLFRFEG